MTKTYWLVTEGGATPALIRVVPEYGYADVVRLTPCSDAGGPDNIYWLECLTVFGLNDPDRLRYASECCGWEVNTKPRTIRDWVTLADAMMSYGYYDQANTYPRASNEIVQVGPDDGGNENIAPSVRLRANANLMRYMRKIACERM